MLYCERAGEGFWSEPINALTNLAFLLAALAIASQLRRAGPGARALWDLWLLTALLAAVAVGSFLWHTLATRWSELADVIPILLFISVFLLSFLVRVARLRLPAVLMWFTLYQVTNHGLQAALPRDLLNGSVFYLPTWASLVLMALFCWRTGRPGSRTLAVGALVFTASLTLRSLDNTLCPAWPLGTHFSWHLLNGLALYLLTTALLRNATATRVVPGTGDVRPPLAG